MMILFCLWLTFPDLTLLYLMAMKPSCRLQHHCVFVTVTLPLISKQT